MAGRRSSIRPAMSDDDSSVAVDGRPLTGPERRVHYRSTSPSASSPPRATRMGARPSSSSPPSALRLYPVGRLDADSSGLILLTNDGELANRLTHPSFEVPKIYRATVRGGPVGEPALAALRRGVELEDGPTAPAGARRLAADTIELTIREGRNRQVRRMCAAVGHPVLSAPARRASGRCASTASGRGASRRLSARRGRAASRASDTIAACPDYLPCAVRRASTATTPRTSWTRRAS